MKVTQVESLDDTRVAHYRRIADPTYLREHHLFVAEGRLVVRRLLTSPSLRTESVLVTRAAYQSLEHFVGQLPMSPPIYLIDRAAMSSLVGFNIHRGCLALALRPDAEGLTAARLDDVTRLVVLEGVNNPDNVGGIFRSAAAFDVDLVVLGPDCGDPLYRKAVRTSMAASLAVPFASTASWPGAIDLLKQSGFTTVALTPARDATPLHSIHRPPRAALLVGAEGNGLSDTALASADLQVRIPMSDRVDSLNVSTAASIAMYHVFGAH